MAAGGALVRRPAHTPRRSRRSGRGLRGTARWVDPYFTWVHDIDWVGSYPDDVGHLEIDGLDLIERGTFELDGRDAPYEERWVRARHEAPTGLVATAAGVQCVQVGDHAIVLIDERSGPGGSVGGFAATRLDRSEGQWHTVFARGIGIEAPVDIDVSGASAVGDRITIGDRQLGVEAVIGAPASIS